MPHAALMAILSSLSFQGPFPPQASKYTVRVPLLTPLLCKRTPLEAPQWTSWGPGFMARDHGSVEVAQTLPKHPPCCQHCTSTGAIKLLNCIRDPPAPADIIHASGFQPMPPPTPPAFTQAPSSQPA